MLEKITENAAPDEDFPAVLKTRLVSLFLKLSYETRKDLPSENEMLVLFSEQQLPQPVIEHSLAVAEAAVTIGGWLAAADIPVDIPVLAAAAVLHDVAKREPDHAARGADYVAKRGYPLLAPLIALHMELVFVPGEVPGEAAILYLADKLCKNTSLVSLEERLDQSLRRYGNLPGIRAKFATAFHIRDSVLRLVAPAGISAAQSELWKVVTGEKSSMSGV